MEQKFSSSIANAKTNVAYYTPSSLQLATIKGTDSLDFLNRISTNDVVTLKEGESTQTVLTSDKGRIIDVLTIICKDNNDLLVLSSNSSIQPTIQWLKKYLIMEDVKIKMLQDYEGIELHGPRCIDVVNELFSFEQYEGTFQKFAFHSETGTYIVRIPSLSEISILLIVPKENTTVMQSISSSLEQLSDYEKEYLRIVAGLGASPNELNDRFNPLEAGLLHIINFKKGCYIGQEVIARLDSYNKVKQRLFGISSKNPLERESSIIVENSAVGTVTSVIQLPNDIYKGLCYIRGEYAQEGFTVTVKNSSEELVNATLNKLPMEHE